MPPLTGSLADPDFRHRRAVHAAKARTNVDHYIQQLVERAPELTSDQKQRLSLLLNGSAPRGGATA